jgi:hypothetical protein
VHEGKAVGIVPTQSIAWLCKHFFCFFANDFVNIFSASFLMTN